LVGKAVNKLDPKGRLTLPAKMRPLLAGPLYLTRNRDGCLRIFTERQFSQEIERLRGVMTGGLSDRDTVRVLAAATEECSLDAQGRLAIPLALRTHADLAPNVDVVVSGMIDFVELWSPERFAEIEARATAS
jgi:MraZ protein